MSLCQFFHYCLVLENEQNIMLIGANVECPRQTHFGCTELELASFPVLMIKAKSPEM